MTEIKKMFENAGVEPQYKKRTECKDGYTVGHPCEKGIACINCNRSVFEDVMPPFTAEKQLKIIQLLSKIRNAIQFCYSDNQYILVVNFETEKCQWANKYHDKPDEALADMVNVLWKSLTNQDKEEIRRILNE